MSTYLYLQCEDHDPPLRSDGEVGQHLYDLPAVREFIKNRHHLAEVYEVSVWPGGTTAAGQWKFNAAKFFLDHPHCDIRIVSEYGEVFPVLSDEDRVGKVFVDFSGNRWWLDGDGKVLVCAPLDGDGTVNMGNVGLPVNGTDNLWVYLRTFLMQAAEEQPSW